LSRGGKHEGELGIHQTIRLTLDGGGQMVHYFFHMGGNTPSRMTGHLFEFLFSFVISMFGL